MGRLVIRRFEQFADCMAASPNGLSPFIMSCVTMKTILFSLQE